MAEPNGRAFGHTLAAGCIVLALITGAVADARGTRDAPPPAHTGGFGEPTCQDCHYEADLNSGSGRLALEGLPAGYRPGASYRLTITLTQRALQAAGFQLSARDSAGAQAGTLENVETPRRRTGITTADNVAYAHHVLAGVEPVGRDSARWTVLWTAPAAGGTVRFHVTANAANDDSSPMGDYIYSLERRVGMAAGKQ